MGWRSSIFHNMKNFVILNAIFEFPKDEISNLDEEPIKESLIKEGASPETISKNLAELKANKVSQKKSNSLVLGADSVIDLSGELISKPESRDEALKILKKLNG